MADNRNTEDPSGLVSPGGFVFGVQGWNWGEPKPRSITFFLDGTAKVSDQWGRPIKGAVDPHTNKEVRFAQTPPSNDDTLVSRKELATHAQVLDALEAEKIDWWKLACSGFPQLPYERLQALRKKGLFAIPPTPIEELRKIRDSALRKDALRTRREIDEEMVKELQAAVEE